MTTPPRKVTVRLILLVPMLAVNLLIIAIFIVTIYGSNLYERLRETEVASMNRAVEYRGEQLQGTFTRLNYLTIGMAGDIEHEITSQVESAVNVGDQLSRSAILTSNALSGCQSILTEAMMRNEATGAFLILDSSISASAAGRVGGINGDRVAAIYINDEDMTSVSTNNSDLILYSGPKSIARDLSIPLDKYWQMELELAAIADIRFVTEPFNGAMAHPELNIEQLGYWSQPRTRIDGKEVIFYTVPLRDTENIPYGVVGVEISLDQLRSKLGVAGLGYADDSFYAITTLDGEEIQPNWMVSSGTFALSHLTHDPISQNELSQFGNAVRQITFQDGVDVTVVSVPLDMYNSAGLFDQQTWALVGGVENHALYSDVNNLNNFFLLSFLIALLVGVVFSVLGANLFIHPVTRLAEQLNGSDPDQRLMLPQTKIKEIDMLIVAIEELSQDLAETGHRIIQTVEMTEMPMGFLEVNYFKKQVYFSDYLFELFGLEHKEGANYITLSQWEDIYTRLQMNADLSQENIYLLDFADQQPFRWVRVKTAQNKDRTFGIIIDVTDELLEKRRLEYERDTDPLTGLSNRLAFFSQAHQKLKEQPGKLGVMLFADLDNLKYVNDTYGHDFGDRYIRAAASIFSQYSQAGGIVARISGDEFAIFIYGCDTKEELTQIVSETYANMGSARLSVPDGTELKVRCSIGFSWYPDDSDDLELLLRYADFAMYETKRATKGSIREFSIESYLKNSYLVEKNEEFNQFIEQNQVSYFFQPIVDIYSGNIFAVEALMRPQSPELNSPYQVLQIARDQAKLYQIERMTMFNVYEWLKEHDGELGSSKVFLNSIPNQMLSDRDLNELKERFNHIFSRSVVEITENEHSDEEQHMEKIKMIRGMGAGVAIDDFGSGYSNEVSVFNSNPNYIKLDMSLVRNAHLEENKQRLAENIIDYAHSQDIKIIAEGIECYEEMEIMIKLGADYLQGYYLARPAPKLEPLPLKVVDAVRRLSSIYRERRGDNERRSDSQ